MKQPSYSFCKLFRRTANMAPRWCHIYRMGDISNNLKEIFGQALNNTSERSEESNKLKNNLQQITIITKFA